MNSIRNLALENVRYDETIHQSTPLKRNNLTLESILSNPEVNELNLDLDNSKKHVYKGKNKYTITVPLKPLKSNLNKNKDKVLLAIFNNETNVMENLRIMFIEQDDEDVKVGFSHIDGSSKVFGTYTKDMTRLIDVQQEGSAVQPMSFDKCIKRVFDSLPWWLKAVCRGVCGGCFALNPFACSACAGCIGGVALDCF